MLDFLLRTGRGRDRRARGPASALGSRRARVPAGSCRVRRGGGIARLLEERRLQAAGIAKPHWYWTGVGKTTGEPAAVEGSTWKWRVDPEALAALDAEDDGRARRLPQPVRQHALRPQAARGALRVRVRARAVQAQAAAQVRLLRAPDPDGRSIRRDAGRRGRPGTRGAARQRRPRVPPVRARGDRHGPRRDRGAGGSGSVCR